MQIGIKEFLGVGLLTATLLLLGFVQDTSSARGADWPMFRYGHRHKGLNPREFFLSPESVPRLRQRWAAATGREIHSSPAVAAGTVYFASDGNLLHAVAARTGVVKWATPPGSVEGSSSPAVANNLVYVSGWFEDVLALAVDTGEVVWSAPTDEAESSPTVVEGVVYVGTDGSPSKLYALDALTGAVRWVMQDPDRLGSFNTSPAVGSDSVYIGGSAVFGRGELFAVNAGNGRVRWTVITEGEIRSSPAIVDGTIYVGSDDALYAVTNNGVIQWAVSIGSVVSSPAVAEGIVYVGSLDGKLYAIDAATGSIRWTVPTGFTIISSPAVANGVVYFGSNDGILRAVNAVTGEVLWGEVIGSWIFSSPAVAHGWVYVGAHDGLLHAYTIPHR